MLQGLHPQGSVAWKSVPPPSSWVQVLVPNAEDGVWGLQKLGRGPEEGAPMMTPEPLPQEGDGREDGAGGRGRLARGRVLTRDQSCRRRGLGLQLQP